MPNRRKRRLFRILVASFVVSFILLVAVSLYALRQINYNNLFSAQLDHTNVVISELYQLDIAVRDLDIQERGYMLTKDSIFIKGLSQLQKEIPSSIQRIKNLVTDNRKQLDLITQLRGTLAMRSDAIKQNLLDYQTNSAAHTNEAFFSGRQLKLEAIGYINQLQKNEYALLLDRYKQKKDTEKVAQSVIQTLIITFFTLTLILFVILLRQVYIRRNFQEELEKRVVDLKRTNEELEQITHALTHDVQEPLRKIQIFSDKLLYTNGEPNKVSEIVERVNRSASTVQGLLEDIEVLLGLRGDKYEENVPLEPMMTSIIKDMNGEITAKKGTVTIEATLPTIKGNYKQLALLFKNLLDNSLKFCHEEKPVLIKICCSSITDEQTNAIPTNEGIEYYRLTIEDNGIGFDNNYTDKIFKIFQRLHDGNEYSGKGIGLALSQRIMNNHNGIITATGEPGKGAIFTLYFLKTDHLI